MSSVRSSLESAQRSDARSFAGALGGPAGLDETKPDVHLFGHAGGGVACQPCKRALAALLAQRGGQGSRTHIGRNEHDPVGIDGHQVVQCIPHLDVFSCVNPVIKDTHQ